MKYEFPSTASTGHYAESYGRGVYIITPPSDTRA